MSRLSRDESPQPVSATRSSETPQTEVWKGEFGREYTDRNTFDVDALERALS